MSEPIVIALITQAAAVMIVLLQQNRKLNRIGGDAREAREQTANNHANAPYPNMRDELTATRDELTATRDEVTAVRGLLHGISRQVSRLETWLRDVSADGAAIEDTLDRKSLAATRALAAAVAERDERIAELLRKDVPELIRRQLSQHVADCPLRSSPLPPGGTT